MRGKWRVLTRPAVGDFAFGAFEMEEVAAAQLHARGRAQLLHIANEAQIAPRLHAYVDRTHAHTRGTRQGQGQ